MEMARHFRPRFAAHGFVAQDDSAELDLVGDPAAAMVGEARIVVADDPRPVEPRRQLGQKLAGAGGEPVATEAVVEAVAEAEQPGRAGPPNLAGERAQRRVRIIRREELAETGEPAR